MPDKETEEPPRIDMGDLHKAAGLGPSIRLLDAAAALVPLPKAPQPIAIADYGCGSGHHSLLPISAAIAAIRRRTRPDHAVLVAHTDRADNDFTALFTTLTNDPNSYLNKDRAAFPSAVGRAYDTQILPSSSIVLGWSSLAIHWLSRLPQPIPDHIQISYSADTSARQAYARQAAYDWHEFVAFRGRELAPGGRVVVVALGIDDDGTSGFAPAMAALVAVIRELVDEGLLRTEEAKQMSLPIVGRSEKEFVAPFAPSGRLEGLAIAEIVRIKAEDRYWTRYQKDRDADAFGANWAAALRDLAFPALGGSSNRREVFDRMEKGVARRLATAPTPMSIPLAILVLEKRR
jgi:hypothetical protein